MRKQTSFDPYHKWLGIPPKDQPPNHYRLIGIDLFETDVDVIDTAANKQMTYLHGCSTGEHSAFAEKILNEIAAVRLCLLDPKQKAEYDEPLFALKSSSELAANSQKKRSFVLPVIAVAVIVAGGLVRVGFLQSKPDQDSGPVDQVTVANTDSKAEEENVETSSVSGPPEAESASVPPQPKKTTSETPRIIRSSTYEWGGSSSDYARYGNLVFEVGMGRNRNGKGMSGIEIENVSKLTVLGRASVKFRGYDSNNFAGFVIDYHTKFGYTKRVALSFGFHSNKRQTAGPPWGTKGGFDELQNLGRRSDYTLDLKQWAPQGWDGKIWFTVMLQNGGTNTFVWAIIISPTKWRQSL